MTPPLERTISKLPRATEHRPEDHVTVRQALEEIRTGRYRSYVERVRAADDKETRRKIKATGPAYTFCGRFAYVDRKNLEAHSGLLCIDYDGVEDLGGLKARLEEDPHVLAYFVSVSGELSQGLKVLVPVEPAPKDNDQNHAAYEAVAARWGVAADTAAKDVSRLCYASYDPDLYVNEGAVPVPVDYSRVPERKPRTRDGEITVLRDGEKYETLRDVGALLRYGGLSGDMIETALQALRETHGESPGEPEPVTALSRWLGEQEAGEAGLSAFRANVIKARPTEMERAVVTGLSQSSQRHNGGDWSAETAIPSVRAVTNGAAPVTAEGGRIVLAADFLRREFPPVAWVVKNVIPEGLTMLAGKPKTGKSFLAVNIAVAVACGGYAMGRLNVEQGRALYINLDSSQREFQKRLHAFDALGDMELAFSWPRLDDGGLDALGDFVERRGDVRLIVIDTLKHIRPPDDQKKRLYDQDYEALMGLAKLARANHGLGIMVIHHANKVRDVEDPFDMISGSTGLTAALDTGMVLRHIAEGTALYVKGKEIAQSDLALAWDPQINTWSYEGPADAFNLTETKQAIHDALRAGVGAPRDIADFTGLDYGNVRQAVIRMAAAGEIRKLGRGTYAPREKPLTPIPFVTNDDDL